jgi:hypothetical protein
MCFYLLWVVMVEPASAFRSSITFDDCPFGTAISPITLDDSCNISVACEEPDPERAACSLPQCQLPCVLSLEQQDCVGTAFHNAADICSWRSRVLPIGHWPSPDRGKRTSVDPCFDCLAISVTWLILLHILCSLGYISSQGSCFIFLVETLYKAIRMRTESTLDVQILPII